MPAPVCYFLAVFRPLLRRACSHLMTNCQQVFDSSNERLPASSLVPIQVSPIQFDQLLTAVDAVKTPRHFET